MTRAALLVLAGLLAGSPSHAADDPAARIAAAEAGVAEAGKALQAAEAAPEQIAALGAAITGYEAAMAELRAGVGEAGGREAELAQDLADRRAEVARLLATLETISRAPAPAGGLHPEGPLGAASARAMTAELMPALRAEAERLAGELAALKAARDLHDKGAAAVADALAVLNKARAAMSAALAEAVPEEPGPASPTVTMIARDSVSLTALAAALAGSADLPAPPAASGTLAWPVAGEVVHHFDERDAAGVRRPGVLLAAPPFALVSAPADAVVRYAGPFLEYGYVVLLEPDPETMLVLAGLARLRVAAGATVRRGDLLGLLGGPSPDAEETVMRPESDSAAGGGETLYIEVRKGQGPVDPEPLFAGEDG